VPEDKLKLTHWPKVGVDPPPGEGWEQLPGVGWVRMERPPGEGWTPSPGGGWSRWAPPPEGGWPKGPPIVFTREDWIARLRPNGEPPTLAPRSSKPAKRTFIDFVPAEWVPAQEAFARITAVVGSGQVAARDLRQDLLAGRLVGAVRWRTSEDGWEACERLDPSVWQAVRVRARHWSDWKTLEISPNPEIFGHSLNWYISRASLEKRYPLLEETAAILAPSTAAEPEPQEPQRLPTYVTKHDWIAIVAEMGRLHRDRNFASASDLAAAALQWCEDTFGFAPSDGEMREAAKTVRAAFLKGPESQPKSGAN
jgi:hypothetical protein